MLAKHALSQLSYSPPRHRPKEHRPKEPRSRQVGAGSTQAKDTRKVWWAREDLNFRPHAYQARALTS